MPPGDSVIAGQDCIMIACIVSLELWMFYLMNVPMTSVSASETDYK